MTSILDYLFGAASFVPHGYCLLWRPDLVALHAVSDTLIGLAYLVIPAAIWVVVRRRKDLPDATRRVAWLFAAFILACAITHFAGLVTLWIPAYGAEGLIKAMTAGVSLIAAAAVWPQIPRILALPSPAQLSAANAALAEANSSLSTTVAERVYELQTVRQRFEQALAGSNITVLTQDRDLRFTWIHNSRLSQNPEEVIGRTDADVLPPDVAEQTIALKRAVLDDGQPRSGSFSVATEGEGTLLLDMSVSPTRDASGAVDGLLSRILDQTEQWLFELRLAALASQLSTANERFRLALENSLITVFEQDRDLRYTFVHNPPPGTTEADFLGRTDEELFSGQDVARLVPPKRRLLETGERETLEAEVEVAGERRAYHLTLEPHVEDAGVVGIIGTAVDFTERRRGERQMRIVMREMTHRSKNLLAVIQSMARKTASMSDDVDGFVADFSARLRAMAAAQDLLVSESWSGADLADLLHDTLSQTIDPESPQVTIEGPRVRLPPDTAQSLGLAFHELATNALKYGALSADAGRLAISWRLDAGEVRLRWVESGGPPVAAPAHRGFGRVLLERLVGTTIRGGVDLDFRPEGLVCEMVFPEEGAVEGTG